MHPCISVIKKGQAKQEDKATLCLSEEPSSEIGKRICDYEDATKYEGEEEISVQGQAYRGAKFEVIM